MMNKTMKMMAREEMHVHIGKLTAETDAQRSKEDAKIARHKAHGALIQSHTDEMVRLMSAPWQQLAIDIRAMK